MDKATLEKAKHLEICIDCLQELKTEIETDKAPRLNAVSTTFLTPDVLDKWVQLNKAFFETQIELKELELAEL